MDSDDDDSTSSDDLLTTSQIIHSLGESGIKIPEHSSPRNIVNGSAGRVHCRKYLY